MIEVRRQRDGALRQGFAGDTANLAVYLARLLPAARVNYVTAVGEDAFSDGMLDAWRAEGIDTSLVRRIRDRLPGLYWIQTDVAGERSFYYWRRQSAARDLLNDDYVARLQTGLDGCSHVCVSGITLAILRVPQRRELCALLNALRRTGSQVVFDSNFRPALWTAADEARACHLDALAVANVVLVSFDDERALFGDKSAELTCDRLGALGIAEVVVRQGAGPCLVQAAGRRDAVAPPAADAVVDTTGAGDAFDAGYLAARCAGESPAGAARAAHRLAAQVVAHAGAMLPRAATPGLDALRARDELRGTGPL
jgi:2-dehydro-3-deoxygluconokinase